MIIYNLFPRLCGKVYGESYTPSWYTHLDRIREMAFDSIFINPIHKVGKSGSLYSIDDYFSVDKKISYDKSGLKNFLFAAKNLNINTIGDLVINHTAVDSVLINEKPHWYEYRDGKIVHPSCVENGKTIIWGDLAKINWYNDDVENTYKYFVNVCKWMIDLGFNGLRCDAAYQVPCHIWKRLINELKSRHDVVFLAETLGCSSQETRALVDAGFDYIFNSSKWWNLEDEWLYKQINEFSNVNSVSFPESHDTKRLFSEFGTEGVLKQRYYLAAMLTSSVMMPMGYEFGSRKSLHVCNTTPNDLDKNVDITKFIKETNKSKRGDNRLLAPGWIEKTNSDNNVLTITKHTSYGDVTFSINKDGTKW